MKRIFLISSYCDNQEKKEVLTQNIKKIKELGFDVLLLSPIPLNNEITNLCDFYFQTTENPVTSIEEKTYIQWTIIKDDYYGKEYRLERFFPEYGWAALYQNKKLSQIALSFDYDIYYHIIYDTVINDGLISEINSNKVNTYYSNKSINGDINEFSLHFLPLDRNGMNSFEKFLIKSNYLGSHDLTHDFMLKWVKNHGIKKGEFIVEEEINFFNYINFFSIYDGDEANLFFERFELNQEKNKFICYDLKTNDIEIIVNGNLFFNDIIEKVPVETNLDTDEIKKIEVRIGDTIHDCTENYNKVGRNKIFYL